jgi:diaminopimelate decarboxylase
MSLNPEKRDPLNLTDSAALPPREARDFEPEIQYLRDRGEGCGSLRFVRWKEVEERIAVFRNLLPGVALVHDLSSESDPLVVERLQRAGVEFSTSGVAHLERLQVLGVPRAAISVTSGAPLPDVIGLARDIQPKVVTVGTLSALESLIKAGCVPTAEWQPTLQILVRQSPDEPLVNPRRLDSIFRRAAEVGFNSFGLSFAVADGFRGAESGERLIEAAGHAARSFVAVGRSIERVQILGGLVDSRSLGEAGQTIDGYMGGVATTVQRLQGILEGVQAGTKPLYEIEGGQLLLGHFPTLTSITNVKRQRTDGVLEVFMVSSVYSDLAGHLYRKTPVHIEVVPDPLGGQPLTGKLVDAVLHGGTCDSVDSLFARGGELVRFKVPEDLRGGCLLAVYGPRLTDGATDFNKIPPAKLVIHDQFDTAVPYTLSALADFQAPHFEAARRFWESHGQELKDFFRETIRQIDSHATVGGVPLSHLPTDNALRTARFQGVAQAFLEQNPDASGTITFLDLQTYAATMRNVGRYLREVDFLRPGETRADLQRRLGDRPPGIDKIFLPIKTFCDPIALMCQAATGFGHDAASAGEMWMSAGAGVSPRDVIVSHPHKTPETLRLVADPTLSPWGVTIDSVQELDRLITAGLAKDVVIFIRYKATGASVVANLSAKFGMPVATDEDKRKVIELLAEARAKGFENFGWAFHVGTQSTNKKDYARALRTAYKLTKMALELEQPIVVENYNIGGGICDERVATKQQTSGKRVLAGIGAEVASFRDAIESLIGQPACLAAEPGRVTCAAAGFMMSQVVAGIEANFTGATTVRWAATRQGILSGNDHDDAFYELMPVRADHAGPKVGQMVYGSSNRPNDVFPSIATDQAHRLPADLQSGDWLMTEGGIAYGWDASGPIDGIDPGRLIAFYTDEQGKPHFIESPWSQREKVRNDFLRAHMEQRGTSAV